ncbi:M16 family metallopeptidase [Acanthopleuribacter pedis]|uniref:Insulinase family protein n=1 Tax=Acanthopleuribacter pedis TaxID=442870 RepID=A0A8J7U7L1_9BACT|nr:pitrilysin family protein [Acanthopleuribacter pedis]MBO1322633.1 insulinase family protein [Acanthopleuribacter pedis]
MVKRFSQLSNGMRVVTERVDHVATVSLGIWLNKGSRHENAAENGLFHFIEHTLFKGTPRFSARDIAEAVDGVGGILDAYTAREETCYSIKVRAVHLESTLALLADMLQHPTFDPHELSLERKVVLEEIKMGEDDPEDRVFELGIQRYWSDHAMGRPILGPVENVKRFDHDEVAAFHGRFYRTQDMVVAAAGDLDHDQLCRLCETLFPVSDRPPADIVESPPEVRGFQAYHTDDRLEQVSFTLFTHGFSQRDPRRHALNLLSVALGGGMSSRLFQSIREQRGLAYSVGCYTVPYADCGYFNLYGACSPENYQTVLSLCFDEIERVQQDGLDAGELRRAKEQVIGSLLMGYESTYNRATSLARALMVHGEIYEPEKWVALIESVEADAVRDAARYAFHPDKRALAGLGAASGRPDDGFLAGRGFHDTPILIPH